MKNIHSNIWENVKGIKGMTLRIPSLFFSYPSKYCGNTHPQTRRKVAYSDLKILSTNGGHGFTEKIKRESLFKLLFCFFF